MNAHRPQRTQTNTQSGALMVTATALIALSTTQAATAADFDIPDGDVQALIDAINAANANRDVNTINLAPGGSYTLKEADNETFGPIALPVVTGDITINGQGAAFVRSDHENTPLLGLLLVDVGANLTLDDIELMEGFAYLIAAVQSNVALSGCTVSGTTGSAVFAEESTLDIIGCTFTSNGSFTNLGGALNLYGGTTTVADTIISDNSITIGSVSRGGGIYVQNNAEVTIIGSTITSNTASDGGAIYSDGSTVTVIDSTIDSNTAARGGGIRSFGNLCITGTTITNNFAPEGGGIHSLWGTVTVSESTISGNGRVPRFVEKLRCGLR